MQVSVLRVEQSDGAGPYSPDYLDDLADMFLEHGDGTHPGPKDDPQLGYMWEEENCGFATLDALDEWFDGYHEALEALGFAISKYLVPIQDVRFGKQQLVFTRGDLIPVERLTLV